MSRTFHHQRSKYRHPARRASTRPGSRALRTNAKRALRGGPMEHVPGYRYSVDFDVCARRRNVRRISSHAEWDGWETWADTGSP